MRQWSQRREMVTQGQTARMGVREELGKTDILTKTRSSLLRQQRAQTARTVLTVKMGRPAKASQSQPFRFPWRAVLAAQKGSKDLAAAAVVVVGP